jgi:hypothetical protein
METFTGPSVLIRSIHILQNTPVIRDMVLKSAIVVLESADPINRKDFSGFTCAEAWDRVVIAQFVIFHEDTRLGWR